MRTRARTKAGFDGGISTFCLHTLNAVVHVLAVVLLCVRERLERLVNSAGCPLGLRPEELMGAMVVGAVSGFIIGLANCFWVSSAWFVSVTTLSGMVFPLLWMASKAREREGAIRKSLPFCLDLLTLTTEAGLDFTTSIGIIMGKQEGNPLASDLKEMLRAISMGCSRRKALEDLDRRVQSEDFTPVVNALLQSDRLGSNLASSLRIISNELRNKRFCKAEEKAHKVPTKMMFPLALLIFPNVFVVIFGPIALHLLGY